MPRRPTNAISQCAPTATEPGRSHTWPAPGSFDPGRSRRPAALAFRSQLPPAETHLPDALVRRLLHAFHQRLLLLGVHLLDRRALLHLAPPRRELRPALGERLRAEHRQHEVREEEGRGESAVREREGVADRVGPPREHQLELVQPEVQLRELLRDELLVLLLRARLREERAERRLEVEVVETRDAAHPGAVLRLLRQERRVREALPEGPVYDLGLPA